MATMNVSLPDPMRDCVEAQARLPGRSSVCPRIGLPL